MATSDGDRAKFFPAIEKKHGGKISQWITRVKELGDAKYPEQDTSGILQKSRCFHR